MWGNVRGIARSGWISTAELFPGFQEFLEMVLGAGDGFQEIPGMIFRRFWG